jgi:hypothetical protein
VTQRRLARAKGRRVRSSPPHPTGPARAIRGDTSRWSIRLPQPSPAMTEQRCEVELPPERVRSKGQGWSLSGRGGERAVGPEAAPWQIPQTAVGSHVVLGSSTPIQPILSLFLRPMTLPTSGIGPCCLRHPARSTLRELAHAQLRILPSPPVERPRDGRKLPTDLIEYSANGGLVA